MTDINKQIFLHYTKGLRIYEQIKDLQDNFADSIDEKKYDEANKHSDKLISLAQEFHVLFYYRPTTANQPKYSWLKDDKLQKELYVLYLALADAEKAYSNTKLDKFIKYYDRVYSKMFEVLEQVKNFIDMEGLKDNPIVKRYANSQRAKINSWMEWTKHYRRSDEERIEQPMNVPTIKQLNRLKQLMNEFKETI
jgi:hypothetical protein